MNKYNKQTWLFIHQTFLFYFSTYLPNSFKHLSYLQTIFQMFDAKNNAGCGQVVPHQQHFLDRKKISFSKHALLVL